MDEIDFDAEFKKLTHALADPEIAISLSEVSEFLELLSETSMHLNRFVSMCLIEKGNLEIPEQLILLIPHLSSGLIETNDIMHEIVCEDDEDEDDDLEEED